ncbi:MAG: MFS transporter [Acidobacteriota bacterium]
MDNKAHRKAVNAWLMYDWANSAFATTIQAAVFGPFYRSLVTQSGLAGSAATAYWAYTNSAALLIISLLGPFLGALSDYGGHRKRYLAVFAGVGVLATASFVFIPQGDFLFASLLFITATIGYACAEIFYDAFLPLICRQSELDRVSARGYALGYVGGGILLLLNAWWIVSPQSFGMPDRDFAIRATFVSVALWWAFFSFPFFAAVPEAPAPDRPPGVGLLTGGFGRLRHTFRSIRRYRQLLLFLAAFWIYNDGIGTMQKMATAYGDELGFDLSQMLTALLLAQFMGIPCTLLFGHLARRCGARPMILAGLFIYCLISVGGYFMHTEAHFYLLALGVGAVQGGIQALSRSLYGSMVPKGRSGEFFGFYSTSSRFAGLFGPLIFGLAGQLSGSSRAGIVSLVIFFAAGGLLLWQVDAEEGAKVARQEDLGYV